MSTSQSSSQSPLSDSLKFIRSLPNAAGVDASKIRGNISNEEKQLNANVLAFFVSKPPAYNAHIGQRIELIESNIRVGRGDSGLEGETVCEITVEEDMCNVYGTMHGGCGAYLIDTCSSSPLVGLGIATGKDASGVSVALNVIWHNPTHVGTHLRIISTSLVLEGRIMASRCEVWDKAKDRLLISAVHTKSQKSTKGTSSRSKL